VARYVFVWFNGDEVSNFLVELMNVSSSVVPYKTPLTSETRNRKNGISDEKIELKSGKNSQKWPLFDRILWILAFVNGVVKSSD